MIEFTKNHVNAISAAAASCLLQMDGKCSPVFKRVMQRHADLLIEVKDYIEELVMQPVFLYDGPCQNYITPTPQKPRDNGTKTK